MITDEASADLAEALRLAALDTVDGAFDYERGEDLDKPGLGVRRRTRVVLTDHSGGEHRLYLKRYGRAALADRLRLLWSRGLGRSPADVECESIRAVRRAGVRTMMPVAQGQERSLLSTGRSYLVVTEVPGDALERCAESHLSSGDEARGADLASALAELVGALHSAGLVHRDLYASHVFLEETGETPRLWLIDLARVFRPRIRRRRWRVKDLSQLRFSMPSDWCERHWDAFLKGYLAAARWGVELPTLRRAVERKSASIARRQQRRAARNAPGDKRQ
jgi:tRNA A-37 threonylcarbamoyl transferase component Bud32